MMWRSRCWCTSQLTRCFSSTLDIITDLEYVVVLERYRTYGTLRAVKLQSVLKGGGCVKRGRSSLAVRVRKQGTREVPMVCGENSVILLSDPGHRLCTYKEITSEIR